MHDISSDGEVSSRVLLVQCEPVNIARRLMFEEERSEAGDHAITLCKVLGRICFILDRKWRETDAGLFTNGIKHIGRAGRTTSGLGHEERIIVAMVAAAPADKVGIVEVRRIK